MIIWRGYGLLVPAIALVVFIIDGASGLAGSRFMNATPWASIPIGLAIGLPVWFLGRYLNRRPGRVVIDKSTGEELELRTKHDLFFIPMEYWGVLFVVGSVVSAILDYRSVHA